MQTKKNKEVKAAPPPNKIHVKDLKTARRLFSRVLDLIQDDCIEPVKAKLLIYGLTAFIGCYRDSELELKVESLEQRLIKADELER
jgi:hypothetical protein